MIRFPLFITILTLAMAIFWIALRTGNRGLRDRLTALENNAPSAAVAIASPAAPIAVTDPLPATLPPEPENEVPVEEEELPPLVIPETVADLGSVLGGLMAKMDDAETEEDAMAMAAEMLGQLPAITGAFKFHEEELATVAGDSEMTATILTDLLELDPAQAAGVEKIILEEKQRAAGLGILELPGFDPQAIENLAELQQSFDASAHRRLLEALPADEREQVGHGLQDFPLRVPLMTAWEKMMSGR